MLSQLLLTCLEIEGLANGHTEWRGYCGIKFPDGLHVSDNAICIVDNPSISPQETSRYLSDGIPSSDGAVTVIIRGVDLKDTLTHFESLCRFFDTLSQKEVISSTGELVTIQSVNRQDNIQYIGLDGTNRRHVAKINYSVQIH